MDHTFVGDHEDVKKDLYSMASPTGFEPVLPP